MKITSNHPILHAVDLMVQDLTMISLNIRAHLLTTNRHIVGVGVVDFGGVDIRHHRHHHHPLIRGRLSIDVVLRGGVGTGEGVVTIRIQVEGDETVLVIHTINLRPPLNTTENQGLRRPITTLIVQELKSERTNPKKIAKILGARCL